MMTSIDVKTFAATQFDWERKDNLISVGVAKVSDLAIDRFPSEFSIHNSRTNQTRHFVTDAEDMERNEFYDGEMQTYCTTDDTIRVCITN
jgi:hypothetical protein